MLGFLDLSGSSSVATGVICVVAGIVYFEELVRSKGRLYAYSVSPKAPNTYSTPAHRSHYDRYVWRIIAWQQHGLASITQTRPRPNTGRSVSHRTVGFCVRRAPGGSNAAGICSSPTHNYRVECTARSNALKLVQLTTIRPVALHGPAGSGSAAGWHRAGRQVGRSAGRKVGRYAVR